MAVDARIQKVEELAAYSNHLGSFIESMSKNFTSFNHVMMQKLQVLRQQRRKAEEIEKEATAEWLRIEHEYAYCPSENVDEKSFLLQKLHDAEHKKKDAQRLSDIVRHEVCVAEGAARCMLDNTQTVQKKLHDNIDKGRSVLKNASVQLEQYKDNSKKV